MTELNYEEDGEENLDKDELKKQDKLEEEKKIWEEKEWDGDPREKAGYHTRGPRLIMEHNEGAMNELGFLFHFLPLDYIRTQIIPATNQKLKSSKRTTQGDICFEEFIVFLGILYSMETIRLGERRMYFQDNDYGYYKTPNYSQHMTRNRFEEIMFYL